MKKKIGIVTIESLNYGNRLQNYALESVLKNNGYEVLTFHRYKKKISIKGLIKSIIDFVMKSKAYRFHQFDKNIKWSRYVLSKEHKPKDLGTFDFFISGSDQIWNPNFKTFEEENFLSFAVDEKKIAYAASIGVSEIGDKFKDCFEKWLKKYKAISVREFDAANIVESLIGIRPDVLIDPTLLLTEQDWKNKEKKPKGIKENEPYVLTYFLSPKCEEALNQIEELREERNVIRELLNPSDKLLINAGPSEFLWLFNHADLVLTDSFHACVFSFLFNKPFIVYDRNWSRGNMNSRLETLLSMFKLENKYYGNILKNDIWDHDYTEGYKRLEIEREKSLKFLRNALDKV